MTGLITAIQRFSVQDGPGIRTTVFLKGCPLRCRWCSNPETQEPAPQLSMVDDRCSSNCKECFLICKNQAITKKRGRIWIDAKKCSLCGECIRTCPESNLKIVGQRVTIRGLMRELLKDRLFYENSGGGITLSGGEPLWQWKFVLSVLQRCKKANLSTLIDTCLAVDWETIKRVDSFVDLFYVDLKHVDDDVHRKYTRASNRLILENLQKMAEEIDARKIVIRVPFIPSINGDQESIAGIARILRSLDARWPVHLLPYHRLGQRKYRIIGREYRMKGIVPPTQEELRKGLERYRSQNIEAEMIM